MPEYKRIWRYDRNCIEHVRFAKPIAPRSTFNVVTYTSFRFAVHLHSMYFRTAIRAPLRAAGVLNARFATICHSRGSYIPLEGTERLQSVSSTTQWKVCAVTLSSPRYRVLR